MKKLVNFLTESSPILEAEFNYKPTTKEELIKILEAEISKQGPKANLNMIDTSLITDMSHLFNHNYHKYAEDFKGDVSKWDVSNVTEFNGMFSGCHDFNCDLSNWNVHSAVRTDYMFLHCYTFESDLSKWDISKVKYAQYMFLRCERFDCDLSRWDMKNVKKKSGIFSSTNMKPGHYPKNL